MTEKGITIYRARDGSFTVQQEDPEGNILVSIHGFAHYEAALAIARSLIAE